MLTSMFHTHGEAEIRLENSSREYDGKFSEYYILQFNNDEKGTDSTVFLKREDIVKLKELFANLELETRGHEEEAE